MILGFRYLDEVFSVNHFKPVEELTLIKGNTQSLFIQIGSGYECDFVRYITDPAAVITYKFNHIDSNKVINGTATMAYSDDDRSIFRIDIGSDAEIAPDSLEVTLSEPTKTQKLLSLGTLRSASVGSGRFSVKG